MPPLQTRTDAPVILVVDDDVAFLRLMHEFLASEQYTPVLCAVASDACGLARLHQPDAIILDLRLPTVDDGCRVLAELRQDLNTAHIPVIMCSADSQAMRQHAGELLHHSFALVDKPFDLDELSTIIRRVLASSAPERLLQERSLCHCANRVERRDGSRFHRLLMYPDISSALGNPR